jgi:aspartate/methionine/tyrosine aminotransferase
MNSRRAEMRSVYLEWAKTRSSAGYSLSASDVLIIPLSRLPVRLEDIEISGPGGYGYAPLQERLARRAGVPVECVVAATGTSMANHLAMAAILEPGDEVLVEHPGYEPILVAGEYLGAHVRRFHRTFESGFCATADEVKRALTQRTRLIVLTNFHNPSGAHTPDTVLCEIGELAARAGAYVLVDEVYREALFDSSPSAFHLGDNFIATSSLTKAYGLSGLRCGWILAPAPLALRMWRLNDLFGVIPAHAAERLSVIALDHLDEIAVWARHHIAANRALVDQFLDSRADLRAVRPPAGTIVFPRLLSGPVDDFCALLREKYETSVVPGRFFEMPEHFRLGFGGETAIVAEGLRRVAAALDEFSPSR